MKKLISKAEDYIWNEKCLISPSLICLDMMHLGEQIKLLEDHGVKMIHVDILDGHFSPSMPIGFETISQLKRITDIVLECHVMADPPAFFIEELLNIGVDQIVFHYETAPHADGLINYIHSKGVRAGLALKPSTPLTVIEYEIEKCDAVLLMQINPGYASSASEDRVIYADKKIRDLRNIINERGLNTKIIIDGRVALDQIKEYGNDIVDVFVCGTTCICAQKIHDSINKIEMIRKGIIG